MKTSASRRGTRKRGRLDQGTTTGRATALAGGKGGRGGGRSRRPGARAGGPAAELEPGTAERIATAETAALALGRHRRVAIAESGRTDQKLAVAMARELGYEVIAEGVAGVRRRLGNRGAADAVVAGVPGAERFIAELVARGPERPVIVASMSGPVDSAREICRDLRADLLALRPHSTDTLATVLFAASQLAAERAEVRALREKEAALRERLQRYGEADLATGFQHIDFFRHVLAMEIKRAKRYRYSLALVLVAIDPSRPGRPQPPPEVARKLRTRVAAAISASIRDIDLPVDISEERLLVFLPYSDLAGATAVGKRVARAVRSYGSLAARGQRYALSVSIGVAALKPGRPVSFARLLRDAGAALRAAQLKGGGRLVVRS